MKKLVIFDMDGTLFDTEAVYARSYQEALAEVGFDFSKEEYAENFAGQSEKANRQAVGEKVDSSDLARKVYQRAEEIRQDIYDQEGVECKAGLQDLLDYLSLKHIKAMVASSSNRKSIEYLLRIQGLQDTFLGIVAGDEVEASKPNPDIFLKAVEISGFDKAEVLVVEDSSAGVEAAHRAGLDVVMIPDMLPASELDLERATYKVDNLKQVISLLTK